jgi:hypothetical protein
MSAVPPAPSAGASNAPHIPPALPPGSDPLLCADRQYQRAAAAFYAGEFAQAADDFREVAANAGSPWRELAPYLAARVLIRQGTVGGSDAALAAAEKALRGILDDPRQKRWRRSAQGLLDFVRARLYPEERMVELGDALLKPGLGDGIQRAITDYTVLWDRLQNGPAAQSALAEWITSFQAGDSRHAVERWRQGLGTPWLIAALASVSPSDPAAPDLIAGARKIRPGDPAYATAAHQGMLLQIARHKKDQARQWADEALAQKLPVEAQNAFRAQRLILARDWTEFLRYAPRRPVAAEADTTDEGLSGYANMVSPETCFARDAGEALNRKVPLDLWVDASRGTLLPRRLQAEIAQAGWVRAVLLNDSAQTLVLARRVAELRPELAEEMQSYAAAKSPDAAKFEAIYLMLRTPGLVPVVREGFGRYAKARRLDQFHDNWWRLSVTIPEDGTKAPADFLTEAQRARGEHDWETLLAAAGTGSNYLCAGTIAWALAHPQDPRVPEALHLAVRTTRYGPRDEGTSAYSRKAFRLLHSRYPNTRWARETKYWF